jgi:hypothetical protein
MGVQAESSFAALTTFIRGATTAFDRITGVRTGPMVESMFTPHAARQLLWQISLPGASHSGAMTGAVDGRQFVTVTAGTTPPARAATITAAEIAGGSIRFVAASTGRCRRAMLLDEMIAPWPRDTIRGPVKPCIPTRLQDSDPRIDASRPAPRLIILIGHRHLAGTEALRRRHAEPA